MTKLPPPLPEDALPPRDDPSFRRSDFVVLLVVVEVAWVAAAVGGVVLMDNLGGAEPYDAASRFALIPIVAAAPLLVLAARRGRGLWMAFGLFLAGAAFFFGYCSALFGGG